MKLQETKTGVRKPVKFFERGIVKNYSLGNSLFIQELLKLAILLPERQKGNSSTEVKKPSDIHRHNVIVIARLF